MRARAKRELNPHKAVDKGTTAHRITANYYRSIGSKELVMNECRFWI